MRLVVFLVLTLTCTSHAAFNEVFNEVGGSFAGVDVAGNYAIVSDNLYDGPGGSNQGRILFWERGTGSSGTWTEVAEFTQPGGGVASQHFGRSLSICEEGYAIAGAVGTASKGVLYVYKRVAGVWTYHQTLDDPTLITNDAMGIAAKSIAIDDDRIAAGVEYRGASDIGDIVVFHRNASDLYEIEDRLSVTGAAAGDRWGHVVDLQGDYISAFAFTADYDGYTDPGAVAIFHWGGATWGQTQFIKSPDPHDFDQFGRDLSFDLDGAGNGYLIIGAPGQDNASTQRGAAHVYSLATGTFSWDAVLTQAEAGSGQLGYSVAISYEDGVAVLADLIENGNEGSARVYRRDGAAGSTTWTFETTLRGSTGSNVVNTGLGSSISLDEGKLLIGSSHATSGFFVFEDAALVPTGLDSSNPLRCGDYDETNQRYFYDDGTGCETTPTVSDACHYSAGELVTTDAVTLRGDLSELKADGGTDYVYLAFDVADKYYNMRLVFADAGTGECAHDDWEQVSATRDVTSLDACETTFVYRLPWSDAYSAAGDKCGWERDDSGANVKLVLDFAVRVDEDLSTMRNGTTITRTSEFSVPVEVQFPVQVTASPVGVQVFAPVRVLAAVTSQSVTIDEVAVEATLTVELFTEVQQPFELFGIVESTDTMPTGVTLETEMAGGNDDEQVRQDAECTNGSADCANTWRWQYSTPSVAGGSNPCDFDGTYQVTFGVRCSDVAETNCPIDGSTDSVEITLTVSTSSHCPTVIDSVDLSAALAVYDLPARADAQDDFVGDGTQDDGQTVDLNDWQVAYFAAPVTSTQVAIDRTEFNQVWIVRHQETVSAADDDLVVLLDADNTINVSPYDGVGEIDCAVVAGVAGADATATAVSGAVGCSPAKDGVGGTYSFNFKHGEGGNSVAGSPSTPIFEFDVRTDSAGFSMADDAIEEMQINAVIDVEYANAAKRAGGAVQNNAQQSTVTSSFSMQTTSSSTGSSGSTALFGMNATVLYGAGAFLVVGVLAVLVVASRRRSSSAMTKIQSSAELTTVSSV